MNTLDASINACFDFSSLLLAAFTTEINNYKQLLEEEKAYVQEQVSGGYTYKDVIGSARQFKEYFLNYLRCHLLTVPFYYLEKPVHVFRRFYSEN